MPENDCKRSARPAYGQTQAADDLATPAREAVCSLNNMLLAEQRAHRRVGYKNSVSRWHMLTMSKCNELCNELTGGTYRPQKGEKHEVFEPRHRIVTSSKYRDRIPQASFIVNYFYPAVVPRLITANCACLKGRGVDMAREIFKQILREANPDDWCVKADMQSYFASIRHDKLFAELGEYITDPWADWFFHITVDNTGGDVGLDLGSEVYQLSATSFPNNLDHLLDNGSYIRYQDDLLYVGTQDSCKAALRLIRSETARLGLIVSDKKTYAQPVKRPIKFLGFSFLRHDTGRVTMKRLPEKLRHERRKLKRMAAKGVPIDRVQQHWRSARACIAKGTRSDLKKMDDYYNNLFTQEDKPC